jgi:hypothetical protein
MRDPRLSLGKAAGCARRSRPGVGRSSRQVPWGAVGRNANCIACACSPSQRPGRGSVFSTVLQAFTDVLDAFGEYNHVSVPWLLAICSRGDTLGSSLSYAYVSLSKTQYAGRNAAACLGVLALRRARRCCAGARLKRWRGVYRNAQTEGYRQADKPALPSAGRADPGRRHGKAC